MAKLARVYLWLMACAAIAVQLYWLRAWHGPLPGGAGTLGLLLLVSALAVVAQHFPVAVAPKRKVSVSLAAYFGALLLFGAPAAVALVGLSQTIGQFSLTLRRNPTTGKRLRTVRSALFNTSQAMVAVGLSGMAYYAFVPHVLPAPLDRWENAWALPAAAAVLYLSNTLAVAVVAALQLGKNPLQVWTGGRRRNVLEFACLFLIGVIVARAGAYDPLLVLAMALPAAIIYWSMDRTVRIEELATREAEFAAWRDLEGMKTEFIRSVSHELRAPLSLVLGFSELLHNQTAQRASDPDTVEFAAQIHANALLVVRLVDDLLDFSRIERGEIEIQPEDFDLVPVLRDLLTGLRRQPAGDRLNGVLPTTLPTHADPARVAQTVFNLVNNAQRYAPEGAITLRAALVQGESAQVPHTVRVEVEDHGPGIPVDEQPRVWEKFYRGPSASGLNGVQGAGIGLAIVKALVEAQGGRVGLTSAPGRGARFWIELPPAAAPAADHARRRSNQPPVVARLTGSPLEPAA